jgi:tetratricopeptide (TPR) repeat protein
MKPRPQSSARTIAIASVLLALTLLVYLPVRTFDFVNYDDPDYVTNNLHVRSGLTADGVLWALTSQDAGNWHPLTWLSHMLDCRLFGLNGGGHHLTSLALHALNTLLLFWVLWRLTGALWRSAWVALLFALHPLHVESVAWVAERKDVLSAAFFFLTILAYIRFVERRTPGRYLAVLLSFCLGLMAKSMLVTLPAVLLLLDVWPLQRTPKIAWRTLLLEKAPLFAVSLTASLLTFLAQRHAGAVTGMDSIPLLSRLANACVSYLTYLIETAWPAGLAAFYPLPVTLPALEAVAAAAAVVALSLLAWRSVRSRPYLFAGWLWYLGTLVPVIGLVQVGSQSRADRYTYLPLIGIFIISAWGLADIVERRPRARSLAVTFAIVSAVACAAATSRQLPYWRNTAALFNHALDVNPENFIALDGLGTLLREQGRQHEAIVKYEAALRIRPSYEPTYVHLAGALLADNRPGASLAQLQQALALNSADPEVYVDLGAALIRLDRFAEAERYYREALSLRPDDAAAHSGLGMALAEQGRIAEGLQQLREAVGINPAYASGHYNLGRTLGLAGQTAEAAAEFTTTVKLEPGNAEAHYNLGTALGNLDRFDEAIREFRIAVQLKPAYVNAHLNLGSALAAAGHLEDAASQFREALRLQPDLPEARRALQEISNQSHDR